MSKISVYGIALILLMTACGQETTVSSNIEGGVTPVWKGSIQDQPELVEVYNETYQCLNTNFGYNWKPMPATAVFSSTEFNVRTVGSSIGAIDLGVVYLYVGGDYQYGALLDWLTKEIARHEFWHWITGLDNEGHESPSYRACTKLGVYSPGL